MRRTLWIGIAMVSILFVSGCTISDGHYVRRHRVVHAPPPVMMHSRGIIVPHGPVIGHYGPPVYGFRGPGHHSRGGGRH